MAICFSFGARLLDIAVTRVLDVVPTEWDDLARLLAKCQAAGVQRVLPDDATHLQVSTLFSARVKLLAHIMLGRQTKKPQSEQGSKNKNNQHEKRKTSLVLGTARIC